MVVSIEGRVDWRLGTGKKHRLDTIDINLM